jgi:hypothetical protein
MQLLGDLLYILVVVNMHCKSASGIGEQEKKWRGTRCHYHRHYYICCPHHYHLRVVGALDTKPSGAKGGMQLLLAVLQILVVVYMHCRIALRIGVQAKHKARRSFAVIIIVVVVRIIVVFVVHSRK